MNTDEISTSQDVIDSRDIKERIDELEELQDEEYDQELTLLNELWGLIVDNFGKESAEFGIILVNDDYWDEWVQQEMEELSEIKSNSFIWGYVNWNRLAEDMKIDYTYIVWDGATFWGRE